MSLEKRQGMALRTAGSGDGAILWIHGYTLDSSIWEELWERLPHWRHIGVDLPGHGAADPVRPGDDLNQLAERLVEVARELNVRNLAAISFGGAVALHVAARAPDAFDSLVVCSSPLGGGQGDAAVQARNLELIRLYRQRGPGPWLQDLWMSSPPDIFKGAKAHPALWLRLREVVGRHSWAEMKDGAMQRILDYPQPPSLLRKIRARTTVFVGELDMPSFHRSAELIRRAVPGAVRHYIPKAGHLGLLERPDWAAAALELLLRKGPHAGVHYKE
jgi:pimeloyl-ACP methyl ester carboxylesterase